jgi:hypothetical protein
MGLKDLGDPLGDGTGGYWALSFLTDFVHRVSGTLRATTILVSLTNSFLQILSLFAIIFRHRGYINKN